MVEKLREIQFTNMSDDTVSISIIIYGIQLKIYSSLRGYYIKKMLVRSNMHATSNKLLNLVNKINLEQKQDVSAGLLSLTFGYLTKTISHKFYKCNIKINVGKSLQFVAVI